MVTTHVKGAVFVFFDYLHIENVQSTPTCFAVMYTFRDI